MNTVGNLEALTATLLAWLTVLDQPEKADAIFVFGGAFLPQKFFEHVANLFFADIAPIIVISGGINKHSPLSEAENIAKELASFGVPRNKMILEAEAQHTLENVQFGMKKLLAVANSPINKVIIISKPFHSRRCVATFNKQFPKLKIISCPPKLSLAEQLGERGLHFFAKRWAGEIKRFIEYYEKGDIVRVEIPNEILAISEKIKSLC